MVSGKKSIHGFLVLRSAVAAAAAAAAKSLQLCPTLRPSWTVAHQASLSMGFSRQEYWTGLPFPPPGDLPHPGIKPTSPVSPALAGRFFTTESPGKLRSLYTGTRLPGHQSSLLPSKAAPGLAPAPCRRNESSFLSWTGDLHPGLSPQLTNRI